MSAEMTALQPLIPEIPGPGRPDAAPRLRPLDRPATRRRPRLAYGIAAVLGAAAIMSAQMVITILTTQDTYAISQLQAEQRQLSWDRQILYDEVAGLSSPQYLAANAAALGMVISEAPTFLRLSDGALVGAAQAASWQSSIDAVGRGAVSNALITDTPLVTAPDATIEGVPVDVTAADGIAATPPPLSDGLPTPTTR